ncbi:glycerophosphoryl diester phosphodiesterase membrane domain-containing protein [Clostridium septicum]|uniref:glycerophosphoryl diester phosphodiesterase membrane domain-containing protein n=1 Tax=Clostridium septicum TaxID=1504 RepID=UPI00272DDB14|nr:glycerophosphoryl diester phosphodiesterase membrane domain-containing protein [Clostridium septicum]WLF68767.1 glycerophosphoryl diester phosphodiesterase membrane domain-containing protein [Clostridium septicum]
MPNNNYSEIKKETKGLIIDTYKNFTFNIKPLIYFELTYRLISTFLFIPINMFIINRFMGQIGVNNITNKDFLKFGLTIKGIIYITMLVIVSFIAIFIEMGVLTYISSKSYKKEKATLMEAILNSIKIVPQTLGFSMIFIVLVAGVIGPLTGIGLYSSLIKKLSIPSFITIELFKTTGGTIFYIAFMILIVILFLRWVLSIPAVIIEDNKLKTAIKNSIKIYKGSKFKIFGYVVAWIIITSIATGILLFLYIMLGGYIIELLGSESIISGIFMVCYILIFYIAYIIAFLISIPLFISFTVELYYKYRNYEVSERKFNSIDIYKNNKFIILIHSKKKITKRVIVGIFIVTVTLIGVNTIFFRVVGKETLVTAHRGSTMKAPENSISSIKQAIFEEADYAEIDVMTTKDNIVVLFHDLTLKRINKSNLAIKDMTFEETQKVDNGSYFSEKFAGEKIPTLEEVLKLAKGKIKLNIELKPMQENEKLAEEVVNLVKKYDMENEVVITSLNYDILQETKNLTNKIPVGYILMAGVGDLTKLNVDFLSVEKSVLKSKLVYAMHALNKEVHVWTINDIDEIEEVISLGADNIITDDVELVEEIKESIKNSGEKDYITIFYETINTILKYIKI